MMTPALGTGWRVPTADFIVDRIALRSSGEINSGRTRARTTWSDLGASAPDLYTGSGVSLPRCDSTISRVFPLGTTVSPIVCRATRNILYASAGDILCGAITVTLAARPVIALPNTNVLHVNPMTHASRS